MVVVDPPSDETFTLKYEGLHHVEGPWCTIHVYRLPGITVIVATDEGDQHEDCSITNRIERVMFLAWEKAGKPWPCAFVEHYEHGIGQSEHFDLVEFPPGERPCWSAGRVVGSEFRTPNWTALRRAGDPKHFLLPARIGR